MRKGGVFLVRTDGVFLECTEGVSLVHTGEVSYVRTGGVSLVHKGGVFLVRTEGVIQSCLHLSCHTHTQVLHDIQQKSCLFISTSAYMYLSHGTVLKFNT